VSDPLKDRARKIAAAAYKSGLLPIPTTCEACGESPAPIDGVRQVHGHHPDYALPLYIIPMCASCHMHMHWGQIPEPRTGRVYGVGLHLPRETFEDRVAVHDLLRFEHGKAVPPEVEFAIREAAEQFAGLSVVARRTAMRRAAGHARRAMGEAPAEAAELIRLVDAPALSSAA
jgi:hypothetical protein